MNNHLFQQKFIFPKKAHDLIVFENTNLKTIGIFFVF